MCNYISSSLHLIVTYARYLEMFKWQNVVYTLHGVWSTLHQHRSKEPGVRNTMKTPRIYYGAVAVFCIAALVIGTAGAATMTQQGTGNNLKEKGGHFGIENMLANLTAQGYEVSAISAAVTSGDYKTAMTLLNEFRTAHPDEFPAHVSGAGKGPVAGQANGERMTQLLSNLTAQGYDVSAISAAVTSGDYKTAMTLLNEFRTAHPDAFPAPHAREAGNGHPGWQGRVQNNQ
jgi:hypothetical protein